MYKAMYERIHSTPYTLDDTDKAILAERADARARLDGPLVGDYLITPGGMLRFTHDWEDTIQTTVRPGYDSSFYLSSSGHMSFSGSLDPGIPKENIAPTGETKEGSCWFFSHNHAAARNGVYVSVPCKVYVLKEVA